MGLFDNVNYDSVLQSLMLLNSKPGHLNQDMYAALEYQQNKRKQQQEEEKARQQQQLRQRAAGLLDPSYNVPGDAYMPARDPSSVESGRVSLLSDADRAKSLTSTGVELGDPSLMSLGKSMMEQYGPGKAPSYGLDVIWAEDEQGNPVLLKSNTGSPALTPANVPPGVRLTAPVNWLNTGSGYTPVPTRAAPGGGAKSVPRELPPEKSLNYVKDKAQVEAQAKTVSNMAGIEPIIQQADDMLSGVRRDDTGKVIGTRPLPTQSGLGTAVDTAAAVFGGAPQGASEAAALKTISGALVSRMPRMEGPQSNMDQQLYREMAGQVGDSSLPIAVRKMALEKVKEMWAKDIGPQAQPKPSQRPASKTIKRTGTLNGRKVVEYSDGSVAYVD